MSLCFCYGLYETTKMTWFLTNLELLSTQLCGGCTFSLCILDVARMDVAYSSMFYFSLSDLCGQHAIDFNRSIL